MYCSFNCREDDRSFHNFCCRSTIYRLPHEIAYIAISVLVGLAKFEDTDLAIEFIESALQNSNKIPVLSTDEVSKHGLFLKLEETHKKLNIEDTYKACVALIGVKRVKQYFETDEKEELLAKLAYQHAKIIENNSFKNEELSGISCVISLINHSCVPNAENVSKDNMNICTALKEIKKGEQIFISYFGSEPVDNSELKNSGDSIAFVKNAGKSKRSHQLKFKNCIFS